MPSRAINRAAVNSIHQFMPDESRLASIYRSQFDTGGDKFLEIKKIHVARNIAPSVSSLKKSIQYELPLLQPPFQPY